MSDTQPSVPAMVKAWKNDDAIFAWSGTDEQNQTLCHIKYALEQEILERSGIAVVYGSQEDMEARDPTIRESAKTIGPEFVTRVQSPYGMTSARPPYTVLMRDKMPLWMTTKVLIHEFGHTLQSVRDKVAFRFGMGYDVESEADLLSYFVMKKFGVDYWPQHWGYFFGELYDSDRDIWDMLSIMPDTTALAKGVAPKTPNDVRTLLGSDKELGVRRLTDNIADTMLALDSQGVRPGKLIVPTS